MAEEAKGQRFSQRAGGFLDKITGSQGAQQTQQTQQQTSGQQSTGGVFLPGISNNQNLINNNKVSMNNGFTQGIQDGTIKSNIVLPGITNKPNEATLDTTTMKQKRQSYIYAKNNNINTKSINEQIEEERTGSNKVLGQTGKILKTYREAPINNFKKRGMRAIADSGLPGYFVDKTLKKAGAPDGLGDSIKDAVNETARKVALTYQNKVNEDFQKKVDKNIDARIREKYDNESITDLIGKGDGAGARYKIWKGTVENWNMIPEIGLMFVNPYVGLATMGTDVYIQENQGTFEDMLQNGATYEQARNGAVAVGILNAGIELFMERFLGGAKWAGATALRRLFLKNAQREVVKQATKKGMAEIFARGVSERLKGSMVEGFEEVLQQITGNIMVKLINPDRDITEGARESFEGGFYNLFNAIGGTTNIANEFKQNEQIQRNADIEALKYVAEGEQRKAQRMAREKARARFLERVKNPTMDNGYTPTPEQAQQREQEKIENEEYEQELQDKYDEEIRIEQDMMNEVLSEGDLNEDLGDPRYQKSDSPQSVSEDTVREKSRNNKEDSSYGGSESSTLGDKSSTGRIKISPENSSEISKSLNEIKKNLEDLKADTFLQKIKDSITGKQGTNYVLNNINGVKYGLRIADHHSTGYNYSTGSDKKRNNTSIVIKLVNKKWKKSNKVNLVEYVYDPNTMSTEIMQGIIDGIQNWIKTGQYTDTHYNDIKQSTKKQGQQQNKEKYQLKYEEEGYTPGVARKDEKNISGKSGKMLKDFLKGQTIEELARKYGVERIDVVKGLVDGMAYGSYSNRILKLAEEIKESTAPHELLHLVFDMVDPETKTYLISQVMQSEGWSAEKAEEWLADSFSNFYRTGKIESAPKSTWGKIKIFFKRVRSFINGMWKWRNQLEQMFTDIIESSGIEELQGKIDSNKEINESKAKMRKRFLEYRRNAEKTQTKMSKSDDKYQRVYHGSPHSFDKFDFSFMGEGEGKQAHGWGGYVAVDERTSRRYAEMRRGSTLISYKGEGFQSLYDGYRDSDEKAGAYELYRTIKYYADKGEYNFDKAKQETISELEKERDFDKKTVDVYNQKEIARKAEGKRLTKGDKEYRDRMLKNYEKAQGKIDAIKKMTEKDWEVEEPKNNLYEVEIPDPVKADTPTGSNYLEENKPLSKNEMDNFIKVFDDNLRERFNDYGISMISYKGNKGGTIYDFLERSFGSDKLASEYLENLGYDGIHYFGGIDGEAYVIFNADKMEIQSHEKYQKAGDINSPAFKKRFGDSKVVDENGNPLVVYHGTEMKFNTFGRGNGEHGKGFYFTDDMDYAEEFSGEDGNTMEVYLKMVKPLRENVDMNSPEMKNLIKGIKDKRGLSEKEIKDCFGNEDWSSELSSKIAKKMGYGKKDVEKTVGWEFEDIDDIGETDYNAYLGAYAWENGLNDLVRESGFDGIISKIYNSDAEGLEYIAFKPNQVKSATDNVGTYDINNDDIRYQRVYHGSPNEFGNFDSSHMGEGEGNQAHGRGHYVAVDPETARRYAQDKFYRNEIELKGRTMARVDDTRDIPYALRSLYRDIFNTFAMGYYDVEEEAKNVLDRTKKEYEETIEYYEELIRNKTKPSVDMTEEDLKVMQESREKALEEYKEALEFIEDLKPEDIKVREISDRRNFYEVEIPDPVEADTPTGSNYLEEGATLKKSEINKLKKAYKEIKGEELDMLSSYRDKHIDGVDVYRSLEQALNSNKEASKFLEAIGYNGIHYYGGVDGEAYVIFDDNDLEIKNHEKYQKVEYEYDEDGKPKWIKFDEDNSERDPSIFGEPTREEQIADDKENEKNNPFYNAWIKYNNQSYKDDQLTFDEFIQGISERGDKEQAEYNKKLSDISEAQNDPQLLDLQLRAVKLMEEEGNVGKKFGKNVSKEVRDRQQKEVESKREQLISDIVDYMYPGLKTEEITYDMQKEADQKEAEREMLGREDLEEKLKYFKKDKNGNREAKEVKIENPDIKLDKILSAGKFEEIFTPLDRVIEWRTPQGQHGVIDNQKNPKQYKSVMEKINAGKTKTKVTLKDVTRDYRALEKYKADQEAEKARKKKERDEAYAKKKQEEYKKIVRMKAFQRLVDMQRFEKYPFLTEEEIKNRYGFTDEEWKKITEQEEIKLPKKWKEKAISDFNKAVYDQVKVIRDGLERQNRMKQKDAEKNLGEIGEIDVDILLGRDEEKGQKEVEEFERLAKEEKEQDSKLEDGKTGFEKEMDRKTRKQKKQAEKLTKQWNEMFRKAEEKRNERYANKEEKVIDEVKTAEEAKEITKESRWKRTKKFWKDTTIQDLIQPISSRIEKISPRIYLEMMRFEQRIAIKQNTRMKQVEDFVKKMAQIRKNNKKDYLNITLHLLNGNVGTANQMLEKYGTSIPRQVLDEMWADAEDVGYTMNYEGFYYPRKVKDVQEFLDRFAKTENKDVQGEIDKVVRKAEEKARKRGEEFTPQQKADLINQLLMDGEVEGISLGSGHMKKRKVDSITKNMLEFYEDPVDSILQYINGMTEAIEKARFLGQGTRGEIKTLGEFIADEGISGYDADELKKLLLSRFNYAPMGEMMSKLKVSANIIHLGSPSSALSQLADISFSLIENGLTNLVQGLANRYNLDLDALGITNRGEELKTQGKNETKWEKLQRFTFKRTGFNMMDQFGKKSFVVSTLNKLIKYAKRNDPQLRKDLSRRFDDPKMIDGVIEDLKVGKMSENVNLFLFTKLADVQPLTRTQMTRTYLQAGNWRVLYAFKTFGIKQLDYIIQKSRRELQTKPTAKALWSIVTMLGIIMLCGAGDDELKDFSMGRKYSSWLWRMIEGNDWSASQLSDRFWDNFLKLFGFTKYSIYQARTQGIKSAIEDIFFSLPGLDMFTYPMQDIQDAMSEDGLDFSQASSWQLIPIVGKYGYWWAGAGQTKQQKSLEKENKKSKGKGKAKI